jgi:hypothetical protein
MCPVAETALQHPLPADAVEKRRLGTALYKGVPARFVDALNAPYA